MTKKSYSKIPNHEEHPKTKRSFLSILTFSWMTPLFKTASQRPLQQDDFPDLVDQQPSQLLFEKYHDQWQAELKTNNPKLWKALMRSLDWSLIWRIIASCFICMFCELLMPVLLYFLLKELTTLEEQNNRSSNHYKEINSGNHTTIVKNSLINNINLPIGMYTLGISLATFTFYMFMTERHNLGLLQGFELMSGLTSLVYNKVVFANEVK